MRNPTDFLRTCQVLVGMPDGTYHLHPTDPTDLSVRCVVRTDGYQVGRPDCALTLIDPTAEEMRAWLTAPRATMSGLPIHESGLCIGKWTDGDGRAIWDVSVTYTGARSFERAIEVAERHGEQEIWDWASRRCIPVAVPTLSPRERAEMVYDSADVARALAGDMDGLVVAFTWAETPQGYDFWDGEYRRGSLSPAGRRILERWHRWYP